MQAAARRAFNSSQGGESRPDRFRDRYQEALRVMIEAKMKGVATKPRAFSTPAPVIDLMAALKRSLEQEAPSVRASTAKRGSKAAPGRRQRALLLPVSGGQRKREKSAAQPAAVTERRRK